MPRLTNPVMLRTCPLWNLLTGHAPTATPPSSVWLCLTMIWRRMFQACLPKYQIIHRTADTDGVSCLPLSFAILCLSIAVFAMGCSSRSSLNTLEDRRQICHWLPLPIPLFDVSAVSIHSFHPVLRSLFTWFLSLPYFCACDLLPCAHI